MQDDKATATRAALSGATKELFQIWKTECLNATFDRLESKRFFQTLHSTTIQVNDQVLSTKASHEAALALLIQTLKDCFTGTNKHRFYGLTCIQGAIQGCGNLQFNVVELLGKFLLQHAGPIVSDDINENYDERIRDLSLQIFELVVESHVAIQGDVSASTAYIDKLLNMTQSIVERRCMEDSEDINVDDYGYQRRPNIGLSILPRSERSLCFQVLSATVSKLSNLQLMRHHEMYADGITVEWDVFCRFVISCLHGESDPRCLMQLLELFSSLLQTFRILKDKFPVSELFDATASYYPINFNPPPNDVHGITRSGLRQAVLNILSSTEYDVYKNADETMARLSTRLILETLVPPPEDDPVSFSEQLETLEDLEEFLLAERRGTRNIENLATREIEQLSVALYAVHESSSLAASNDSVAKRLAILCREVVAKVALACETTPTHWDVFVQDCIRKLHLNSTESGRVAVAYLACLASCGGAKTLQMCMETGITRLLGLVDDANERASALFGIGALFSSCRAAMDNAYARGINIRPHPLQSFGAKALDLVFESQGNDHPQPAKVAAIRAMESVLLASPATAFTEEHETQTVEILHRLLNRLMAVDAPEGIVDEGQTFDEDEMKACSQTIGGLLMSALAVSEKIESTTPTLLSSEKVQTFLLDGVFSSLVQSVQVSAVGLQPSRFDRKALAMASSANVRAASRIMGLLNDSLIASLRDEDATRTNTIVDTMAFLFEETDGHAARAFQEISKPAATLFDIVDLLAPVSKDDRGLEANFGLSWLNLPRTNEAIQADRSRIIQASRLVEKLRTAYETVVEEDHFGHLVFAVDEVLPPLSGEALTRLSVLLPLFSAAMENVQPREASPKNEMNPFSLVRTMGPSLFELAMSTDSFQEARVHAGRCLHASIAKFTPRNAQECPARSLAQTRLIPSMREAIQSIGKKVSGQNSDPVALFCESTSMLALLGSAAACRGGPSSKTSDSIMTFLIDLACTGKSAMLFSDNANGEIDLSAFDRVGVYEATRLSVRSALLLGSILSTENGNLIWKQRLTHIAIKKIIAFAESDDYSIGLLATVCQITCTNSLQGVSTENLQKIARIVLYGLKQSSLDAAKAMVPMVTELVLASLIKLLSIAPSILKNDLFPIVTGSMRAYASASSDVEQSSRMSCKLLALQALEAVSEVNGARDVLETVKPAILSILESAMNDPCALLRRAAVEVRNSWCLV